jgi:hypothetical protein
MRSPVLSRPAFVNVTSFKGYQGTGLELKNKVSEILRVYADDEPAAQAALAEIVDWIRPLREYHEGKRETV